MTRNDFDRFVAEQQARLKELPPFDPKKRLEEWRRHIEALYAEITYFLADYIERELANVVFAETSLHEDLLGDYSLRQMTIGIGASTITFKPAGTIVVGARGRVDVFGPRGVVRLVLIDKTVTSPRQLVSVRSFAPGEVDATTSRSYDAAQVEWVWKIATPPPDITFTDLTQDTVFDMILSIANA